MSSPKIFVFGATGAIGSEVSKVLAEKKIPFRAVARGAEKAETLKKLGSNIETVDVNVWDPVSVEKALHGIEKVFLLTPPGQTKSGYVIADAIKKVGTVKHIVKLSALGSETTNGEFIWAEQHRELEEYIAKLGISVTSLRPSAFFTNVYHDIPTAKATGCVFKHAGDAKINHISNRDIAEVAVIALTQPGHEGKVYNLTGVDTLSLTEYVKLLSEKLGKEVKYVDINEEQLRTETSKHFPADSELIDQFVNMIKYFKAGGYDRTFPDLEQLLGRKPRNLKDFLQNEVQA